MEVKGKTASGARFMTPQMRSFIFIFLFTFLVTFALLSAFGLVPESSSKQSSIAQAQTVNTKYLETSPIVERDAVPVRVVADAIKLDVNIKNPASVDIKTLDQALLSGAVRYPNSGKLSDNENMLLFGHSSFLPVVHNQMYKAFNGIKDLHKGDIVRVYSAKREYLYRVESVTHVTASNAIVSFKEGDKRLTLSTCDSFGKESDRFVVDASFVGSYPLES